MIEDMTQDMDLYEKFGFVQFLMGTQRHARARGAFPTRDASRGQGRILALLKVKDGLSAKDMANVLGIRTSSLNESIAKLERAGLVHREKSPDDGRIMLVYLTEEGKAQEFSEPEQPTAFDALTPEEQAIMEGYLDRVIEALISSLSDEERAWIEHAGRSREDAAARIFCGSHAERWSRFGGFGGRSGFPGGGFGGRGGFPSGGFGGREGFPGRGPAGHEGCSYSAVDLQNDVPGNGFDNRGGFPGTAQAREAPRPDFADRRNQPRPESDQQ